MQTIIVGTPGPQGPKGEIGPQGPSGPLTPSNSGSFEITGSLLITDGITGSFTGSFIGDGAGLSNIPASGITGLNLSQIASGSVTASISPSTGFRVNTSASITGSLNLTGALTASSAVISGDVIIQGTASVNSLVVNQISYSSGSNQLGDAANDTQTLYGSVIIPTGSLTVTGSTTITGTQVASSGIGRTMLITSSISASANNDVLVGLDINPTFNTGSFTGVTNWGLRSTGLAQFRNTSGQLVFEVNDFTRLQSGISAIVYGNGTTGNLRIYPGQSTSGFTALYLNATSTGNAIDSGTTTLSLQTNSTARLTVFNNPGNIGIGTTTDSGFKLDVNGTARFVSAVTFNNSATNTSGGFVHSSSSPSNDAFYTLFLGSIRFYVRSNGYCKTTTSIVTDANGLGSVDASAISQIDSTTKGFLPPRTNLTSNISSPAQGLQTYITASATEGLYYYNSGSYQGWTRVLNNSGSQSITGDLIVTGSLTIQPTSSATQIVSIIQAGSGSIALVPSGSGAIMASIPDGTTVGGNARGTNAVDLQVSRASAAAVAVGNFSSIIGGSGNQSSGAYSISGGQLNSAVGSHSVCFGNTNSAGGQSTAVFGQSNSASTNFSTVSGGQSNTASTGTHATVVGGSGNTSSGQYSVSGGQSNTASGTRSIAFGGSNNSSGAEAVSLGFGNTSSNFYSVAIGQGNTSSGLRSIALGRGLNISGDYATGIGYLNNASALYSFVSGYYATAYLQGQNTYSSQPFTVGIWGQAQYSNLCAIREATLTTAQTASLSLDGTGTTNLIIPTGANRTWNTTVNWVATVTGSSGTTTGVTVGDSIYGVSEFGFKVSASIASITPLIRDSIVADTAIMETATLTYATGSSNSLAMTLTAPTFAGGGSLGMRVVAKVSLVELAW